MTVLAGHLAAVQQAQPLSPLQAETIVVQSNELARWLSLYLAHAHGIASHIDYPFPSAFIWSLFRRLLPDIPQDSAYAKEALGWRIFDCLPTCRGLPEFSAVDRYLGENDDERKLFALSFRLADTFDQYLMYRPQWIQQWEQGHRPHWQAVLWKKIVEGDEEPKHRANLLFRLKQRLEQDTVSRYVPERVSIFGISTLPPVYLELFALLSQHCEVTIYFQSPSEEYWGDRVSRRNAAVYSDKAICFSGHPLLSSLGKQGQAFFELLQHCQPEETFLYQPVTADSLLGRLQRDIFSLSEAPQKTGKSPGIISREDDSIRIHSCHSALREIEVLYDQLLDLFERHPELAPTDVVVMTPDIDAYAPWIEAVFANAPADRFIPFGIADSTVRLNSPIVTAFKQILWLPQSRFDVESIVALLECEAIQRKFELDELQLEWIQQWLRETHIHWGLSAQDKQELGLPAVMNHTWRAGLDRLLMGYAMPLDSDDPQADCFAGIPGVEGVAGERAQTVASLCALIDQLAAIRQRLQGNYPVEQWPLLLLQIVDELFLASADDDSDHHQLLLIRQTLSLMQTSAQAAGFAGRLALDTVRQWLDSHLDNEQASSRFMGHGVTFCGMVPMRSIPFEVVCLIGMNDTDFPRQQPAAGFDLLSQPGQFRPGDRSRREDDRYLFLEAILSAQSHLYISYIGASIADNADMPPSVLVSELKDTLQAYYRGEQKEDIWSQLLIRHPLQAFSPRYFNQRDPQLFSYQAENCVAVQANSNMPWLAGRLPEADAEWRQCHLDQLLAFFNHPARYLCEQRLGLRIDRQEERLETREPFELNGLQAWTVRQHILSSCLQHVRSDTVFQRLSASGELPYGQMGEQIFNREQQQVEEFIARLPADMLNTAAEKRLFELEIAGFRLTGQLEYYAETTQIDYYLGKSRRGAPLLKSWLRHLLLNCMVTEGQAAHSYLIMPAQDYHFLPVTEAEKYLTELLQLYWQGLHQPIPLFPETSYAYAQAYFNGSSRTCPEQKARTCWEGGYQRAGEGQDSYYQQLYLHAKSPLDDDFRQMAQAIYGPVVQHLAGGRL